MYPTSIFLNFPLDRMNLDMTSPQRESLSLEHTWKPFNGREKSSLGGA